MPAASMARRDLLGDELVPIDEERRVLGLAGGIRQRRRREPPDEPLPELVPDGLAGALVRGGPGGAGHVRRVGGRDPAPFLGPAVLFLGDHVLGDVDETARQVARVGGPEGRVGEALAGAVGRDEVLEDRHAFAEVAPHGDVDDPARRIGHEAAHRAELADVALVTAGPGVGHHPEGVVLRE